MIKSFLRFSLLVMLCFLLVYAPEICSSVSAPYSLSIPQRTLLRVALYGVNSTSKQIQNAISAYQKAHPSVHMRIAMLGDQQLTPPYPDVIVCVSPNPAHLPQSFSVAASNASVHAYTPKEGLPAAHDFSSYIVEALSGVGVHSEI